MKIQDSYTGLASSEVKAAVDILRQGGVLYALLFGSAATSSMGPGSDVDIAVFADRPIPGQALHDLRCRLAEVFFRPVDLIDMNVARGLVYAEAMKGTPLFCDDDSIKAKALIRRLGLIEEDLEYARKTFQAATPRIFS